MESTFSCQLGHHAKFFVAWFIITVRPYPDHLRWPIAQYSESSDDDCLVMYQQCPTPVVNYESSCWLLYLIIISLIYELSEDDIT